MQQVQYMISIKKKVPNSHISIAAFHEAGNDKQKDGDKEKYIIVYINGRKIKIRINK